MGERFEIDYVMLLRVDVRKPSTQKKYIAVVQCDVCDCIFERSYTQIKKQTFHICSKKCMTTSLRRGGALNSKRMFSVKNKYGVEHVSQIKIIKERKKQTSLVKFGCDHPFQSEQVKEKKRQTCMERFGVEFPMQSAQIMQKRIETSRSKYGTAFPFERSEIREKAATTNVEKFGAAVPIHSAEIRAKTDWSQQKFKAHQTMKLNESYGKSKPEDRLYEVLCEMFGVDDVERQVLVHKWPIDFHIKSIDTYVQYDSYWHGVGRHIDEVAEHKTKRDVNIHKKMLTDITQKMYFDEHELRLIRVQNLDTKQITIAEVKSELNR